MAVTSSDKALLSAAAVLILLSAGTFGYLGYKAMLSPSGPIPQVELASVPYEAVGADAPAVKMETWAAPVAQSRGREWIYDTFTPPEIFYSARTRQFTVRPPASLMDDESLEVFGLELVSVRPEPFRLQLIGFVGEEGNWRGMFQNMVTGEMVLGGSGHKVPKLNLTIKEFTVRQQAIGSPESMTTRQRVANAVVRDEISGTDVILSHRERFFTDTVFAYLAEPGETATREVRSGDVVKIGDASFKIEKIQTTPPTVEIVKESPSLPQPERRVVPLREIEAADPAEPGSVPSPSPGPGP
ncbi:MAG: hypothetical protein V4773_10680 [Verrucomicrobiota bacterium]